MTFPEHCYSVNVAICSAHRRASSGASPFTTEPHPTTKGLQAAQDRGTLQSNREEEPNPYSNHHDQMSDRLKKSKCISLAEIYRATRPGSAHLQLQHREAEASLVYRTPQSLTSSLKYETPPPSDPAHVFKPQQGDVHTQLGPALPDATHVVGAYSGHQGHWRREVYDWEEHRAQQNSWARNSGF